MVRTAGPSGASVDCFDPWRRVGNFDRVPFGLHTISGRVYFIQVIKDDNATLELDGGTYTDVPEVVIPVDYVG
jgi:hypothetical protein